MEASTRGVGLFSLSNSASSWVRLVGRDARWPMQAARSHTIDRRSPAMERRSPAASRWPLRRRSLGEADCVLRGRGGSWILSL